MVADDASGDDAHLAVPCDMARQAPDDGALDTSLRLGSGGSERDAQKEGGKDQRLHGGSPKDQSLRQSRMG